MYFQMCDKFIDQITKLLEGLSIEDSCEQVLDNLNRLFGSFTEELQLLEDDERAAQSARNVEIQRVFHNAGLTIIGRLSSQQQPMQQEHDEMMSVDDHVPSNQAERNSVEVVTTTGSAAFSNNDKGLNDIVQSAPEPLQPGLEDGAWGGQDEEPKNSSEPNAAGSSKLEASN